MTGRLLTARAVADTLDVSPATVLRWTRAGELPAIRLPSGQIRYRAEELEAWLGERATPNRGALTAADGAAHDQTLSARFYGCAAHDQTLSSLGLTAVPTEE